MRELLTLLERRDMTALTKQTKELDKLLSELEKPLRKVTFGHFRDSTASDERKDSIRDGIARDIVSRSKAVIAAMDITFEDEAFGKAIKSKMRKWENFKKMLQKFADADGWDEMQAVSKSLETKSKWAWDKYRDYRDFAMFALSSIDSERMGTVDVGPFTVRLISAAGETWDRDAADKVKYIIEKAMKGLGSVGLSKAIGGKINAYPTKTVPTSGHGGGGTLALYNIKLDQFQIAVGGNPDRVAKTMVHEFGHRVYYRVMGNRGRRAWGEFFGENSGKPDLRQIMKLWEDYAKINKHGAWFGQFYPALRKMAPDQVMWAELAAESIGLKEKFHGMTGAPTKGKKNIPGLEVFKSKMGKIKVFLHPVTTYSGTNPSELFAETFAFMIQKGPQRIPPVTRHAFTRALPQIKGGSRMMESALQRIEQLA